MRGDEKCFLRNSYYTGFQKQESISLMFFCTGHGKLRTMDEALNANEIRSINLIIENPSIRQKDIIEISGISRAQVQRTMKSLQERGIISNENSKKRGKWIVNI